MTRIVGTLRRPPAECPKSERPATHESSAGRFEKSVSAAQLLEVGLILRGRHHGRCQNVVMVAFLHLPEVIRVLREDAA
jgi:hypothetical protein